jgi:hypothetical protein
VFAHTTHSRSLKTMVTGVEESLSSKIGRLVGCLDLKVAEYDNQQLVRQLAYADH